ncbi:MAG: calcineurin-like phosphoesterase C-terminal domain-containing protein [Bacteroidales bacterium]|nr:calcineurin-like phosphoesterase C-terminal domain-containing protein [Bacteroidales bacterium]
MIGLKRNSAIAMSIVAMALSLNAPSTFASTPLKVAFVADPQADGEIQLDYCRKSIYKELRERKDLDMVIFLGDLVNDDVELLAPTKATLDSLRCPWFCLPGNHDRDRYPALDGKRRPRDLKTYLEVFGYGDTTVSRKGVHFILMNDVQAWPEEYSAGFTSSQKAYLESALKAIPQNELAVLSVHIPLSEFKQKDSLSAILSLHPKMLVMCGHTHMNKRHRIGPDDVEEVNVGAACGMFWTGRIGSDGLPSALMNCGAPRGYYVAEFRKKGYFLAYKCVGKDEDYSATAWVTSDNHLVVNVFGGSEDGSVQARFRGSHGWVDLSRKKMPAPETLEVIAFNKTIPHSKGRKRNPEYSPMRTMNSSHVWSASLNGTGISPEKGRIRIRYKDKSMKFSETMPLRDANMQ